MRAIETSGIIDEQRRLHVDEPLPAEAGAVRVIILIPDEPEVDERDWQCLAATNRAFDFLKDPAEDIYTLADGKPFAHSE